jgi:hypothetical protein
VLLFVTGLNITVPEEEVLKFGRNRAMFFGISIKAVLS